MQLNALKNIDINEPGIYIFGKGVEEGSLEDAILKVLADSGDVVSDASDRFEDSRSLVVGLDSKEKDTYKTLNVGEYMEFIAGFDDVLKHYVTRLDEELKEHSRIFNTFERAFYDSTKYARKCGFKIGLGDSIQDFIKKNRTNKHYRDIPIEMMDHMRDYLSETSDICRKARESLREDTELKNMASRARGNVKRIMDALSVIDDLQSRDDITIHAEEVDRHIVSFIAGTINRSRLYKLIFPKQEEDHAAIIEKHRAQHNLSIMQSVPDNSVHPEIDKKKQYELEKRGLRHSYARELIAEGRYDVIVGFMRSVETIFDARSINIAESYAIYQRNPELLKQTKQQLTEYSAALESLFDVQDPAKSSGILPKNNAVLYASSEEIKKHLETSRSNLTDVTIEGLEKIANEHDRQFVKEKLSANPFSGECVKKHITGNFKTCMYDAYSKEAGEGHYRKLKLGRKRRAIFKLENTGDGTYHINIINYFDTHTAHSAFFQRDV